MIFERDSPDIANTSHILPGTQIQKYNFTTNISISYFTPLRDRGRSNQADFPTKNI